MSPKKKAVIEEEDDEHESDEDSAKELESLGKQLTQAGKSKDALVKLLKVRETSDMRSLCGCRRTPVPTLLVS